jgi:hypothetical protein
VGNVKWAGDAVHSAVQRKPHDLMKSSSLLLTTHCSSITIDIHNRFREFAPKVDIPLSVIMPRI